MKILVLNGGSSSFKCWFADLPDDWLPASAPQPLWTARVDWSRHSGRAQMQIRRSGGEVVNRTVDAAAPVAVLKPVLEALWEGDARAVNSRSDIDAVGHRIVHGGPGIGKACRSRRKCARLSPPRLSLRHPTIALNSKRFKP